MTLAFFANIDKPGASFSASSSNHQSFRTLRVVSSLSARWNGIPLISAYRFPSRNARSPACFDRIALILSDSAALQIVDNFKPSLRTPQYLQTPVLSDISQPPFHQPLPSLPFAPTLPFHVTYFSSPCHSIPEHFSGQCVVLPFCVWESANTHGAPFTSDPSVSTQYQGIVACPPAFSISTRISFAS
ncbi:hypothetical protein JMJ78_0008834 [Colletotrichum scovillei]|nr:hypothetical protein JMJ78_0008834 [Colletotrichum scovillei]